MSRDAYTGAEVDSVQPEDFLDQYSGHVGTFYDAAFFRLTDASGTDDITATLSPDFDAGGLKSGMRFSFVSPAANTGPVTLSINGGTPIDVLDARGVALPQDAFSAGLMLHVEYDGSDFRLTSALGVDTGALFGHWVFESSDTWEKPDGLADGRAVMLEAWGAGAGGGSDSGGGGGGYAWRTVRAEELPSSLSVTVAPGASAGTHGGNTTLGSLLTAYGGQAGSGDNGGRGAGSHESGADGGYIGGGDGGTPFEAPDIDAQPPEAAQDRYAGGGGASSGTSPAEVRNGARAVWGGGGGGGGTSGDPGNGGPSIHGGNGGNHGQAGQPRGGGGGRDAPGGRGEARITLL